MNEPNGDLISIDDGANWEHLTDYNMDYTWNLRGYVTNVTGATISLPSVNEGVNSNNTKSETQPISSLDSSNKTKYIESKANRTISSFNIYRKDDYGSSDYELYANVPALQGTTHYCYYDMASEYFAYYYKVTAVWVDSLNQECESVPARSLINPNDDYVYVFYWDGVEDQDSKSLLIYPNPASENVTIESRKMNRISVTNILGQRVYDAVFQDADKVVLNIEDYEAGVYVVRIETAEGTISKRFTVVR
jgi:hypothetical protein